MTPASIPLTQELVLIGGGHAHALVLRRWGMHPLPGARLTLINPGPTAPYTGMLPGHVAGHYPRAALEIDLIRLARFAGARLVLDRVTGIDRAQRRIQTKAGRKIAYDIAAIDVGITSAMPDLPGFQEYGIAAKPLDHFATSWERYLGNDGPAAIAVIGGGVAGCELALAMAHALRDRGRPSEIHVIDAGPALAELGYRAREMLRSELASAGITVIDRMAVTSISADSVLIADGREIPSDFTVGAAGARPWDWISETGLAASNGFLDVNDRLQTSNPAIFASGDCANLAFAPRPKAGVFAVRAAPVLAHNLRAALSRGTLRRFAPQQDYLKLISLGRKAAMGEKWGMVLRGPWIWNWKDRIDRRFMNKLTRFPNMPAPVIPRETAQGVRDILSQSKPLCGGCGSKVGRGQLTRALATVPVSHRDDVQTPPGDDAALLTMGSVRQVITTDHLRAFIDDPHTLARIAALHAMGDIWAMGARPQAALAQIILPRMSGSLQENWLTEIMEGAADAFGAAGAAIAGGHTTIGSELTIGFTVTGLLERDPITLAGAKPGDILLLTRPVGSGTLLAAEMSLQARGEDIAGLLAEMLRPQERAAELLAPHAHAMTDVTGFGLAGHLRGMLDASDSSAELLLDSIPTFPGAEDLANRGVRSTLHPENRAAAPVQGPDTARTALLHDPQTAGGLLAAVPADVGPQILKDLLANGYQAARIGKILPGPPSLSVR